MRGYCDVVVGPTFPSPVFRAVGPEGNAQIQAQAIALSGPIASLNVEEGKKAHGTLDLIHLRARALREKSATDLHR